MFPFLMLSFAQYQKKIYIYIVFLFLVLDVLIIDVKVERQNKNKNWCDCLTVRQKIAKFIIIIIIILYILFRSFQHGTLSCRLIIVFSFRNNKRKKKTSLKYIHRISLSYSKLTCKDFYEMDTSTIYTNGICGNYSKSKTARVLYSLPASRWIRIITG